MEGGEVSQTQWSGQLKLKLEQDMEAVRPFESGNSSAEVRCWILATAWLLENWKTGSGTNAIDGSCQSRFPARKVMCRVMIMVKRKD